MNDTFSGQNSAAFYQAVPQNQATDPAANPVVTDTAVAGGMPANPPSDNAALAPIVTPHSDLATPADSAPSPAPSQDQSQPVVAAPADMSTQSSPEEVIRRLADRIKAYQAKQGQAEAAASPAVPAMTAPAGQVVVTADEVKSETTDPQQPTPVSATPTTSNPSQVETTHTTAQANLMQSAPTQVATPDPATISTPHDSEALSSEASDSQEESLDAQNIFALLGVMDGTEAEKDAFLDQLQQVIWEDFLENDVQLLLTKDEVSQLQAILTKPEQSEADKQEAAVVYLEKLVPDLENIMLEKALELKREMVFERIAGLRELHGGKADVLAKITQAELLFKQDKWQSGSKALNSL